MAPVNISVDEFVGARPMRNKGGNAVLKASKGPASWNGASRTAQFVMSAEIEDHDKDIVRQQGLDTSVFEQNPVAPFSHQSGNLPLGTWQDISKVLGGRPKRTEGTLKLLDEGKDPFVDTFANHVEGGTIRACSIGFIPKTIQRRNQPEDADTYSWPGYDILEATLLECSPCVIPANPAALAKAAESGDPEALAIIAQIFDEWEHKSTGLFLPRPLLETARHEGKGSPTSVVVRTPKGELATVTFNPAADGGVTVDGAEIVPPATDPVVELKAQTETLFGKILKKLGLNAQGEPETVEPTAEELAEAERLAIAKRAELVDLDCRMASIDSAIGVHAPT